MKPEGETQRKLAFLLEVREVEQRHQTGLKMMGKVISEEKAFESLTALANSQG